MEVTIVLPSIVPSWTDACLASMNKKFRDRTMVVDNTRTNIGYPASVNLGIDRMMEEDSDWLVTLSAAIRFGKPGGMDFLQTLENSPHTHVVEADHVFGWHLIAFSAETIRAVGKRDENLGPYGPDDIDYSIRISRAFGRNLPTSEKEGWPFWPKVPVDCTDAGMGHSIHLGGVVTPAGPLWEYFRKKWGRYPGDAFEPTFERPFGDPSNGIDYWPEASK